MYNTTHKGKTVRFSVKMTCSVIICLFALMTSVPAFAGDGARKFIKHVKNDYTLKVNGLSANDYDMLLHPEKRVLIGLADEPQIFGVSRDTFVVVLLSAMILTTVVLYNSADSDDHGPKGTGGGSI